MAHTRLLSSFYAASFFVFHYSAQLSTSHITAETRFTKFFKIMLSLSASWPNLIFLQSPNCSIWSERQTAKLKRDLKFRRVRLDICDDNPEKSFNNPLHATLQLVWVWVEKGGENLDAQLQIHVGHYDLGEDEFAVQLILVWYFRMSCN